MSISNFHRLLVLCAIFYLAYTVTLGSDPADSHSANVVEMFKQWKELTPTDVGDLSNHSDEKVHLSVDQQYAQNVRFMGKTHQMKDWRRMKRHLHKLYSEGKWVEEALTGDLKIMYDRACTLSAIFTRGNCISSPSFQGYRWKWKPTREDTQWLNWSPELMCKIANGRNIMVVGDSLNEQLYYTWVSSVWAQLFVPSGNKESDKVWNKRRDDQVMSCWKFCPHFARKCEGPATVRCGDLPSFELSYAWSRHLDLYEYDNTTERMAESGWTRALRSRNISLVVMNTGAHYQENHHLLANVEAALNYTTTYFPHVGIIYRNTAPGHPNCMTTFQSSPLKQPIPDAEYMKEPQFTYKWFAFKSQNALVHRLIETKFPQVLQVNIFNATLLRADSHPSADDCLHYCIPGPIDEWLVFVFNAIVRGSGFAHTHGHGHATAKDVTKSAAHLSALSPSSLSLLSSSSSVSSIASRVIRTYPLNEASEGDLIKYRHDTFNSIYLVKNGTRRIVPNAFTFNALGFKMKDVYTLGDVEYFNRIPVGPPFPKAALADGTVIRRHKDNTLYLVANASYRAIPDQFSFTAMGLDSSKVFAVDDNELLSGLQLGPPLPRAPLADNLLIRLARRKELYVVRGGHKRLVPDAYTARAMGLNVDHVAVIDDEAFFNSIPLRDPLPRIAVQEGTVLQLKNNKTLYLIKGGRRRSFPSMDTFAAMGFNSSSVLVVDDPVTVNSIPLGEVLPAVTT